MKVFVGTSGWYYEWNRDKTLDWYIANSGLNAIELNASFYRFPLPNQVESWARKGESLRWVVKVNRLITHQFKFSEKAVETWQKFSMLFSVMNDLIDFFLFQLPPNLTSSAKSKVASFLERTGVTERCALEPRHDSWFKPEMISWAKSVGLTWVSIDAPEFTRDIFKSGASVYLRMHGRTGWYRHNYKTAELKEIGMRLMAVQPLKAYVFFNNDHYMLRNAQSMYEMLRDRKV